MCGICTCFGWYPACRAGRWRSRHTAHGVLDLGQSDLMHKIQKRLTFKYGGGVNHLSGLITFSRHISSRDSMIKSIKCIINILFYSLQTVSRCARVQHRRRWLSFATSVSGATKLFPVRPFFSGLRWLCQCEPDYISELHVLVTSLNEARSVRQLGRACFRAYCCARGVTPSMLYCARTSCVTRLFLEK